MHKTIKIGGASGYWGESAMATPQLLTSGDLDYLVYDYLAEITMSIMARVKAKDPTKGYATDFLDFVMKPHLEQIASSGVKIIANAGGVNPQSCGAAVRALIVEKGLSLKVAVITGDDVTSNKDRIAAKGLVDMFSGAPFPDVDKIMSVNTYLGAFPIAKALAAGADIVITGRCVDSAVTLGACIHEFGWKASDFGLLASGSLAGHILECGPQATGGNFTDWEDAGDISNIGYPIAEISADGSFITAKPKNTGGVVNVGTVSEQMLYEIGDPQAYLLPDVSCDFSDVKISQQGDNRVLVSSAKGYAPPPAYKTCLTYRDGFRAGTYVTIYGGNATAKAEKFAAAALARANRFLRLFNLGEYTEFSSEILGSGSQFGQARENDEVVMKLAVKHPDPKAVGIFLKELAGLGLATPPGLSGFTGGGRAKPSPVVRLFSYLTPKPDVSVNIDIDGNIQTHEDVLFEHEGLIAGPDSPPSVSDAAFEVPLIELAWGRSGDKGNKANIGIIARRAEYIPYIWAALTPEKIGEVYRHFTDDPKAIERFYLPGSNAMNILIDNVLGGGGATSLRNDAQAKGYAQILLAQSISVSKDIVHSLKGKL
ncbi:MAG: acyclic terpene utilization AtuA family protein [Hellea sp.]